MSEQMDSCTKAALSGLAGLLALVGSALLGALVAAWIFPTAAIARTDVATPPAIKLVLQITIDQMNGDTLAQRASRFADGGFRRLLNTGTVYTNAHFLHANTETIVGHATIATGTTPSVHGMIGNVWLDRDENRLRYNIEDDRYRVVGEASDATARAGLSGPESVARSSGRSPAAMLAPTFADELLTAGSDRARAFSVAGKDRAAVPMAGHGGKAFWYSKTSGRFVSSTRYYEALPDWTQRWNAAALGSRYANKKWTLLGPLESYEARNDDDRPYEIAMPGFCRVFPHAYGAADNELFQTFVSASPAGDELTLEFAKTLIDEEHLGRRGATDYLAIGFSASDYIGHLFDPNSLEAEDNLLRLDRTVAALLAHVDERVGLDATIVVLSADHGVSEAPEASKARGFDAQRLSIDVITGPSIRAAVKERFGDDKLIQRFSHPYVYLNHARIADRKLDVAEVERFVAARIAELDGVERAVAAADLSTGDADLVMRQIRANHHPTRSGDVVVVARPHWLPYTGTGTKPLAATHGSPWTFDTHVPIVFMGPSVPAVHVDRLVHPRDIAPTLSAYLSIPRPGNATGTALREVLDARPKR
jgi:predicted AlkP superfamily pyrophosphatase or phosphodiesterase